MNVAFVSDGSATILTLARALTVRGHRVLPTEALHEADLVVVGSHVPDGADVAAVVLENARGVTAFYDLDTPLTLSKLGLRDEHYLPAELVPRFDLYLSACGGPSLQKLELDWGARRARPLYPAADPELLFPEYRARRWLLAYGLDFDAGRQPMLERLLVEPARTIPDEQFAVMGRGYPSSLRWPWNIERLDGASDVHDFYAKLGFALVLSNAGDAEAGWAPSAALFEAAACGAAVFSNWWEGLDDFFEPGTEVIVARDTVDVIEVLAGLGEAERIALGERARARVVAQHTPAHRAAQLEAEVAAVAKVGA